jgi:DNA-binding transcriptional MocR family regulator
MAALRDATALVDLATAALPAHARMRHLLGALASAQTATVLDTPGYLPSGLPALRQAVATRLAARGLATDPDQVLVTTGDQQALSLLCAHALHPGDTAVVESPTSPGILDVLYSMPVAVFGARPVAVESADLIREVDRREARLAYLMPTLGPSGRILQHAARAQLARALAGRSTLIVDDTSQAELSFGPVPAPLAAFTDAPNLITTGSLTKLHWGGLRLGWIRGPAPLIAALTRAKARADLGTPVLDQILAVQLLQEEDDIRADRITELRACLAHATSMLRRHLPELTFEPPAGGLSMWLRLPEGTATAFAEVATRLGVAVVPGALLSHQGSADDHIRLVYTRPPEVFDEGVHRLAVAWHHYRRTTMSTVAALSPAPVLLT